MPDNIVCPPQMTEAEFQQYIDHDDDTECHGMPTDSDIAASILEDEPSASREPLSDSDDDEPEFQLPVTSTQSDNCLLTLRRAMEEHNCTDFTLYYKFEEQMQKMFAAARRQSKMTEFTQWIP